MGPVCITWDWKDQPPLTKILEAAKSMTDYGHVFQFALPDTGGDYYACILSEQVLTPAEIEAVLASEA